MQKIVVKGNELGLDTYINGIPDIALIPKEIADSIIAAQVQGVDGITDNISKQLRSILRN